MLYFLLSVLVLYTPIFCNDYSDAIYASLSSITDPTEKDYQKVQNYIYYGVIPNIDRIIDWKREQYQRDFRITPTDGSSITYKVVDVNSKGGKKINCIVLYGSFNEGQPEKTKALLKLIRSSKFKGHVIYRVGGWPNLAAGDLVRSHIPGAYVVSALYEAYLLGFRRVLWLDGSIIPQTNLNKIFQAINKNNLYAYRLQFNLKNYFPYGSNRMAYSLSSEVAQTLYTLSSDIVGVDLKDKEALSFLRKWHNYTAKREKMSLVPQMETALLSFLANECYPADHFPYYEEHINTEDKKNLHFTTN